MKHVKRILAALAYGLFIGICIGLLHKLNNLDTWLLFAFYSGLFTAFGCWIGIGIEFFHKDDDKQ